MNKNFWKKENFHIKFNVSRFVENKWHIVPDQLEVMGDEKEMELLAIERQQNKTKFFVQFQSKIMWGRFVKSFLQKEEITIIFLNILTMKHKKRVA